MGKCALVAAVDFNEEHFLAQSFDYLIAVDAGFGHLKRIGVDPDCVVGDFDSLGFVPDHPQVKHLPTHKDESDIEVALEIALEKGYDDLVVYGCLGGRLDFTYALTQLLVRFARRGCTICAIGGDVAVCALHGAIHNSLEFSAGAQGTVSVFAASEKALGVDEEGFEYPLNQATLYDDKPLGVSNVLKGNAARISLLQGDLIVFFPIEATTFAQITRH